MITPAGEWSAEALEAQLSEAMGPHLKAEFMAPEVARLLSLLWEAHQLDLERIDSLRAHVAALEELKVQPPDGGDDGRSS